MFSGIVPRKHRVRCGNIANNIPRLKLTAPGKAEIRFKPHTHVGHSHNGGRIFPILPIDFCSPFV
jgi:hypothetical protein